MSRLSGIYHHVRVCVYFPIWRRWDRVAEPVREWAHRRLLAWVRGHVGCNVCYNCCKPYTHREIHWRCNREDMADGRTSNVCDRCLECPVDEEDRDECDWDKDRYMYRWAMDMQHVFRTNRDGSVTRLSARKAKADARRGIRREFSRIDVRWEDPIRDGRFRAWARGAFG